MIKKNIKNLWEKLVIHKYVYYGIQWGNYGSFGYNSNWEKFEYWQTKYKELGYIPVSTHIWVSCSQYLSKLRIKNE